MKKFRLVIAVAALFALLIAAPAPSTAAMKLKNIR